MPGLVVALYVTGHGFGHAVRSAEVARQLLARGARVLLRTEAPRWLFPTGVECLDGAADGPLDVGVVQRDGLEMDLAETRRRWAEFVDALPRRVAAEAGLLAAAGVDVVVGDVPPLAFAAAAAAGVPGVAVANFGWDWIYTAWPGFEAAVDATRGCYRQASLLLRLPLHAPDPAAFAAFHCVEDVPLVARQPTRSRDQVRATLGLGATDVAVLLSFGGFDAAALDLTALGRWPRYRFLLSPAKGTAPDARGLPPNVCVLPQADADYVSLVAACDAVVTKPGYGIVADCLTVKVPVLYTDRGPFREYPVLVQALHALGTAQHAPQEAVRQGALGPYLDDLLARPRQFADVPTDGAAVIAERVLTIGTARRGSPSPP